MSPLHDLGYRTRISVWIVEIFQSRYLSNNERETYVLTLAYVSVSFENFSMLG